MQNPSHSLLGEFRTRAYEQVSWLLDYALLLPSRVKPQWLASIDRSDRKQSFQLQWRDRTGISPVSLKRLSATHRLKLYVEGQYMA